MKLAVISDTTYRACLPDDPNCLGYYGSENMHAVLADALVKRGHDVSFFAPSGSTEIGHFYPLRLTFGESEQYDSLDHTSYGKLSYKMLLDMDFVIDMSSHCKNVEMLNYYHGFKKYCCYRNGYAAFGVPRLPVNERNYIVPSKANATLFDESGFPSKPIYYGISEFYYDGRCDDYFKVFEKQGLIDKGFWLFPHRPTYEKGTEIVLRLANDFPQETFVIAGHTPITEHMLALTELKRRTIGSNLTNLLFVDIPLNPKHHYFKRELYRRAKATLAPFLYPAYKEGFGLSTMEAIACGTPVIISNSPSTKELFIDEKDALICDGYKSFKLYVEHFSSYLLTPTNRYSVEDYARNYEELANNKQANQISVGAHSQ